MIKPSALLQDLADDGKVAVNESTTRNRDGTFQNHLLLAPHVRLGTQLESETLTPATKWKELTIFAARVALSSNVLHDEEARAEARPMSRKFPSLQF